MPQEIQDQIYGLVFAELVHVQYDNVSHRLAHHVCRSPLSERESYEAFMSSNTGVRGGNDKEWICSPDNSMPFALLRVNHRISKAAKSMAIESTTFSFSSPDSVVQFIHRLPGTQPSLVCKIQLDMTMGNGFEIAKWGWAIAYALLPRLVNVRHIYLCVRVRTAMLWTGGYTISDIVEELDWMRPVVALAQIPLWSATAIIAEIPAREPVNIATNPNHAPYPIPHSYYGPSYVNNYLGADAHQPRLSSSDQHTVNKDFAEYIRKKLLRED